MDDAMVHRDLSAVVGPIQKPPATYKSEIRLSVQTSQAVVPNQLF